VGRKTGRTFVNASFAACEKVSRKVRLRPDSAVRLPDAVTT